MPDMHTLYSALWHDKLDQLGFDLVLTCFDIPSKTMNALESFVYDNQALPSYGALFRVTVSDLPTMQAYVDKVNKLLAVGKRYP